MCHRFGSSSSARSPRAGRCTGIRSGSRHRSDRTETWTDIQVGSVYGALKRLANEDLVREVRTEKVGNRPERTVYEITPEGRRSLAAIHDAALRDLDRHFDPFDLALAQARDIPEERPREDRREPHRRSPGPAGDAASRGRAADPYVNEAERMVIQHLIARTEAEIRWHTELAARLPKIAADFASGIGGPQQTDRS